MPTLLERITTLGRPFVGPAIWISNTFSVNLLGSLGFDYVFIDMEHAPVHQTAMTDTVHAIARSSHNKTLSIVRVPSHGVEYIKWALDSGANGIVVPMVQSRAETERVVQCARYPPDGQRSFGPFMAQWADMSPDSSVAKYFSTQAKDVAVIVQIESKQGLENAEEIMSTPGISGVFVGPADLRLSMGLPGMDGSEEVFVNALNKVLELGKKHNIAVGMLALSPQRLEELTEQGFHFFLYGGDTRFLQKGAELALEDARKLKFPGGSKI